MTPEENYYRAVEFRSPEVIPCRVSLLPATWGKHREALEELVGRHPDIFGAHTPNEERNFEDYRGTYAVGEHVDNWGCVWKNIRGGMDALVTEFPLDDWARFEDYEPPTSGGMPHGFMYMRLYYLRGFESFMRDLAEEPPQLQQLVDMVLEYNMNELEERLSGDARIHYFGDDLGMQDRLPMSPAHWRKYLKPCFGRIFGRCRESGAYVYLHTDGHILPIIPDLIDCGVTVLNPQFRSNTLEGLIETCKGKVAVDLDLDRQMFPFCTPDDIDEHVHEAVAGLGSPEGGLMLLAECAPDVPLEIIEAICQAFEKYRFFYSG
ncbi:MAG: uroporphyrinogen decarboxylase family protein [Planctomycetota bacterium]|jgi:hypothetical protein|nr:uroporphyrinogen decarboxylase family protein [Planctomycetota bacterium]MDP7248712.1 uroporphyrinogen decarboxylase family protein [Planctomycetota bacterium]